MPNSYQIGSKERATSQKQGELTASPSLTGFLYQFQGSILEILSLDKSNSSEQSKAAAWVTFEGVQDLDVETEKSMRSIQFKYLPSKTLCASTVRWTVLGCLGVLGSGYRKPVTEYELIIYVSRDMGWRLRSVDDLKELGRFSYQSKKRDYVRDSGLSDEALQKFVESFRLRLGGSLEETYAEVISALCAKFRCSIRDAEEYYYPKAIEHSLDLSTRPLLADRRVSVTDFIKSVKGKRRRVIRKGLESDELTGVGMERGLGLLREKLKIEKGWWHGRPRL